MEDSALVDQIAELLKQHRGKANAIRSAAIARKFGIPDNDTTRQTRHLVKEAMKRHRLPVGGLRDGYFIIETAQELAECALDLQNRIDRTEDRLILLKETYYEAYGQPNGDDEGED